jgi:hypothetical protein
MFRNRASKHYIAGYFVAAPYAGHGMAMQQLFLPDGLAGKRKMENS